MGKLKVQRYFMKPNEEDVKKDDTKESNPEKVETYDVTDIKKKPWGRRWDSTRNQKQVTKSKLTGRVPIAPEVLQKYDKGTGTNQKAVRTVVHKKRIERKEHNIKFATELAARAEILLTEDAGFLEADAGETTTQFTQRDIVKSVDISAAAKHFELQLHDFGPYRSKYTRNGRHLLLGGRKGHVAAFDWVTKSLHCEINVMEAVHDVSWLHLETMFAVAQKNWVYIYDNQGIELHCIKRLNNVSRMEFLPYHFLLASCSDEGYLSWLDISIGQLVSQYNSKLGRLSLLSQNPWNAVLCVGHAKGVVSMWSPNSRDPLAKMLCHKAPISGLHVDPSGMYMATSSTNRDIKIWDIRKLEGPLQEYKLPAVANNLNFSQKKLLAVGTGNLVEVYRDCCTTTAKRPYLRHRFATPVSNFNFCPYEDVLGVSTGRGFTSLLVPGAGEANFDALEANPYQSKTQRREAEVKSLLEKIQPELITLDPTNIAEVDVPTLKDKIDAKTKLLYVKPPKINYEPRRKAKGKGGSVKMSRNKKIVQEEAKKKFVNEIKDLKIKPTIVNKKNKPKEKDVSILDRFVSTKKAK